MVLFNGSYYHFVKVVCWLWWLYFNMSNWIFRFCLLFLPVIPSALKDIVFCFYFPFTSSVTRLLLGKSRQRKSRQNAQLFICIWQSRRTMLSSGLSSRGKKKMIFAPSSHQMHLLDLCQPQNLIATWLTLEHLFQVKID